ncbi:MAG: uracil-DNA glycosylase [Microbacter sp.]
MDVRIEKSWKIQLSEEFDKAYFQQLVAFVKHEYVNGLVFPQAKDIFHAFDLCPFDQTKVVIIGQDPYHEPNQAHGLCFSVKDGVSFPPSLINIFKEIQDDLQIPVPTSGNLERWAKQGVLLLNATLTVRAHQAGSHQHKGWEQFTDKVIELLASKNEHLVFMLWGAYAQKKGDMISSSNHLILKSPHPSPLSAHKGFFGNHHFSQANRYLMEHGKTPIQW